MNLGKRVFNEQSQFIEDDELLLEEKDLMDKNL